MFIDTPGQFSEPERRPWWVSETQYGFPYVPLEADPVRIILYMARWAFALNSSAYPPSQ